MPDPRLAQIFARAKNDQKLRDAAQQEVNEEYEREHAKAMRAALQWKKHLRAATVAEYAEWVVGQLHLMDSLDKLRGKVLGFWCSPKPCHGDVLIDLCLKKQ